MTADPAEIKACCAASYGQDAVALVLGESYHPGGLNLTRRLADVLGLRSGLRVVDVASGPGATARLLAGEYDVTVDGVDLGESTVERARSAVEEAGLVDRVRFHLGDAERLPLPDGSADAVVCECAFCTFPDKATAAEEFARVLRPGGRVGITDVTVAEDGLPEELRTLAAWVACIADARPVGQYTDILAGAGLVTGYVEEHDAALARMVEQIEARVRVLRMTAADRLAAAGVDVDAVLRYTALAKHAVTDGLLGYRLLVAEKPT
ncbi:class I SAM-dependent methyltransferase [Amycolatopsis echigonensis]|uniref:Methyltransferase domain-containing protein n=1 Tax=Amycolatopsis echigonensis TaxID=2576905 RepID=A0A8E1W4J9_9PSEU|nr:methyltransferase domain-containing protein [Amycolatopsis echigonensis]MBB2504010.1 methyltransferase domain-containing protein [Amycolatopsis echigonensis]